MSLTLNQPPGFCDLPDAVLAAEEIAYAIHAGRISQNAEFGMVRLEIFSGVYKHGDTVPLPTSDRDGYNYQRDELLYFWTVRNSAEPQTLWLTGPDSLWFTNWNVQQWDATQAADSEFNQHAGEVFSQEWYRRSGTHSQAAASNDGKIQVFTIGQRLRQQLIVAVSPTYTAVDETTIATDKPWKQALAQQLNGNAKFADLNTEVFYLGEYTNGQTVTLPVSQAGPLGNPYAYSLAECKFMAAWRWTASANVYQQPPEFQGQLGPFKWAISNAGVVSISVDFIDDFGGLEVHTDYGRVAVFAFCTRANGPAPGLALARDFTELDDAFFAPGQTLRASTVLAIKKNADEAILTPEFFGPTVYKNGDIVALPVSPIDGYAYSRAELIYIWSWSDTTNQTGQNLRIPIFYGRIDQDTGLVHLNVWRLPPGSDPVDDNDSLCRITVLVVGFRQAQHPELFDNSDPNPPDFPPPIPNALFGAASDLTVDLTAPSGAESGFTVAHGLGQTPAFVKIEMTSGGNIWLDGTAYDGTTLYLKGSAAGVTGKAYLFKTAPAAELTASPSAPGDFAVPHSLGAVPGLVQVQMRSGGNIWTQPAVADASFVYLTASDADTTAHIGLWLGLTANASPSVNVLEIPLKATADGNFQVAHGLGIVPKNVFVRMNSPGFPAFWFQSTLYDDVNVYLVSPGAGVSGFAEVLY